MAEPSSTTVGAVAAATGVITLSGSIIGLQYDALLFGLFGGLISLMHVTVDSPRRMAGILATAALLGAFAALLAPPWAYASLDWVKVMPRDAFRLACALVVGFGSQWGIPVVMRWVSSKAPAGGQP